ncbi:MAG: hypothetical protein ABIG42_04520, partial [bacterium]
MQTGSPQHMQIGSPQHMQTGSPQHMQIGSPQHKPDAEWKSAAQTGCRVEVRSTNRMQSGS